MWMWKGLRSIPGSSRDSGFAWWMWWIKVAPLSIWWYFLLWFLFSISELCSMRRMLKRRWPLGDKATRLSLAVRGRCCETVVGLVA